MASGSSGQEAGAAPPPVNAAALDATSDEAAGSARFLWRAGYVLLASALVHGAVFVVKGGPLTGPVSWRKPMLFSLSIGVTAIAIAYIAPALSLSRRAGRWLLGALGALGLVEVFLVAMQQWRGVASHFNFFGTPFDAAVAGTIAGAIAPVALIIFMLTARAFRTGMRAPGEMIIAIRAGLGLMSLGMVVGMTMIANAVTQFVTRSGKPPAIFGAAGVMKIPHALCLHGLQFLLVLAWLARATDWDEGRRRFILTAAAGGYCGLVLAAAFQTYNGLWIFDVRRFTMVCVVFCVPTLVATFGVTLFSALKSARSKGERGQSDGAVRLHQRT